MTTQEIQTRYLPLSRPLFLTALALLGNAQDAEDAVQDTFLKMWQQADRVAAMERSEAYFGTTLRHICLNMLRSRRDGPEPEDIMQEAPPSDDADRRAESRSERSFIYSLARRLPAKVRRICLLRHVGEYSIEEIAALTAEKPNTVAVTLSRARKELRTQYLKHTDHET